MAKRVPNQFFDSQDVLLNIKQEHTWGNFGYWENTQDYPAACEQLATKLGEAVSLTASDRVLDLGFGCGDQLQLWHERFGVEQIEGWNVSEFQCAIARQKALPKGVTLHCGDFFSKAFSEQPQFDKVLALDSAYHFDTRTRFFDFADQHLRPGGKLGLVDISFSMESVKPWHRSFVKLMASMAKIPQDNLSNKNEIQRALGKHFELEQWHDITPLVFMPFCDFIRSHHSQFSRFISASLWRKYHVTSRALTYLCEHELIQMNLVIARKF